MELFYDELLEKAIKRIIEAYRFSQHLGLGKLYVGFSGGKDSVCTYGVTRLAAKELGMEVLDMCDFHYNVTGIDHPELVYFIRKEFPFVKRDLYKKSMWQLMLERKFYPTRLMRFCCKELKEHGGEGRFCVMGVRWAESPARSKRSEFESIGKTKKDGVMLNSDNSEDRKTMEHCIPKNKYVCNPIIDWSDDMVWEFIQRESLPYCSLYDKGWTRLGCIGCPMAKKSEKERMWEEYPKFKEQYIRTFDKIIKIRKEKGMSCSWKNGQEMFEQWQEK
jgi:phosphoadenosine phosphosulfate reductase